MINGDYHKGRGAQINPENRFNALIRVKEHWEGIDCDEEIDLATKFIEVFPKSILNKVSSPDIPMEYSLNPYQGCEHGCVYCYARPTHEYWGYSPGIDFEKIILVKKNAAELLEDEFQNPKHKVSAIMLSGNTDCYQPCEKKFRITRSILKMCLKYKHPVGIISKNTLLMRDADVLKELAEENLVSVTFSLTTLNEELRRVLEPRTATVSKKLLAIKNLTEIGVPVGVMVAPIIPALNDTEIFNIIKFVGEAGAIRAGYQIVRLNGKNGEIFNDWVTKNFPYRSNKIINTLKEMHGGNVTDSRFSIRMKGEGHYALQIKRQFEIATRKFLPANVRIKLATDKFIQTNRGQMNLF